MTTIEDLMRAAAAMGERNLVDALERITPPPSKAPTALENLLDAAEVAIDCCELLIGRPLMNGRMSAEERDAREALDALRTAVTAAKGEP